jgi:hypothetical protein
MREEVRIEDDDGIETLIGSTASVRTGKQGRTRPEPRNRRWKMKALLLVLTILVIAVGGCTSMARDAAPEPTPESIVEPTPEASPETVIRAAIEAWNAGEVEVLGDSYGDDAVICFPDWGDECTSGDQEIAEWVEELVAAHFAIEPDTIQAEGDTVTVVARVWADPTRELGIAPLVTTDIYTVESGRITRQTSKLAEESAARLMEAMAAAERAAVVNAAHEAWNAGDIGSLTPLFAEDATVCFPDFGGECSAGAEEIATWIEELVVSNFVIYPESVEVEGDTVTVVAEVWADPTRELGIAPLVTRDVYTVEDGQITNQTSTLTEGSAARLMEAIGALASQPSAVVVAFTEAINGGDLQAAMALLHEGLYAELAPTLLPGFASVSGAKKEDVNAWMEEAIALNTQIETEILSEEGRQVTARSRITSDYLQELDAAPLVVNEIFKVQDGQVQSWSRTITASSVEKLQEGLAELGVPAAIAPEPGEVLANEASQLIGVWTGAIAGGFEGPVEFTPDGSYQMEGDSGSYWFNGPYVLMKTEKEHYGGDPRHSCTKGLIGSYVVYMTQSEDQITGLRYVSILDLCPLRRSFFEGETHTPG